MTDLGIWRRGELDFLLNAADFVELLVNSSEGLTGG